MNNEPVAWKAYDEVNFSDQYILRWVREGDEYVNRITKEMIEDFKAVVRQLQAENKDKKLVNDIFADLIKKQGEKIDAQQTKLDVAEQQVLDAFERGKMFGYAEGLRKASEK